jgi:hypothetical protein
VSSEALRALALCFLRIGVVASKAPVQGCWLGHHVSELVKATLSGRSGSSMLMMRWYRFLSPVQGTQQRSSLYTSVSCLIKGSVYLRTATAFGVVFDSSCYAAPCGAGTGIVTISSVLDERVAVLFALGGRGSCAGNKLKKVIFNQG